MQRLHRGKYSIGLGIAKQPVDDGVAVIRQLLLVTGKLCLA